MTFGLTVSDWIDEYEVFKIAPGPIEIDSKIFVTDWTVHHTWFKEQSYIYGHRHAVSGARDALSILEPGYRGGCKDKIRATVEESIRGHSERIGTVNLECQVAANAGFFDMTTGDCMGKVHNRFILGLPDPQLYTWFPVETFRPILNLEKATSLVIHNLFDLYRARYRLLE